MKKNNILIDASCLVYYTNVRKEHDFFRSLKTLFSEALIAPEVYNEYINKSIKGKERVSEIGEISATGGFFRLCTKSDFLTSVFLHTTKGVDKGEAAIIAQQNSVRCKFILSDDKKFRNKIMELDKSLRVINSLNIIAMLDLNKFHNDCNELKKIIYSQRKFKSSDLREAYEFTAKDIGKKLTNKELSEKTSLKKIGIIK